MGSEDIEVLRDEDGLFWKLVCFSFRLSYIHLSGLMSESTINLFIEFM